MYSICFVCLGNICRSPTAEGVFLSRLRTAGLEGKLRVDSAGTAGWHEGRRADPRSREAAARRGFDLPSRARKFRPEDLETHDLIVVMDAQNRSDVLDLCAEEDARVRVRLFREFDPLSEAEAEVPDPYHGGADGFEEVLDLCERASDGLLNWLRAEGHLAL